MHELRKERLIIALIIIAQTGFIIETLFSGWELWMTPLIVLGIFAILFIHFTQKLVVNHRVAVYFILAAVSVFYAGSHENGFVNPAVLIALLMISFALFDRVLYLNISLVEYILIMLYRIIVIHISGGGLDRHSVAEIIAHFAALISIYALCRISVSDRNLKKEEMAFYRDAIDKEHADVGDFMSNVSHELRTPVNVINGMTAIISKDVDRKELKSIIEACIRLTHQIDDIKDYTEVRRNELILTESDYMVDSLIDDAKTYYKTSESKDKLNLIVDLDPGTPAVLRGDIEKLQKILRLLLDNALKFTKKGEVCLKVSSDPREYGVNLIIELKDTGIGMTRGQIARLSTGMYQANKKRTRSTGGIGLGLFIVYGFVRKMGGFVKIESEKGQGTTVHLSIPQQVVDKSPCLSLGKIPFDGLKALIVDDEPMNLVVATGIFKEYGLILDTAESGKEAIEKYTNGDYDIVFMDHMMPEMDGVEAMKSIRKVASESNRDPVILALTANVLSGAREMFIKEGFNGFLAKPIDITEFERVMKNVLPEKPETKNGGQSDE